MLALVILRVLVDVRRPRAVQADLILFGPLAAAGFIVLAVYLRNARLTIEHDRVGTIDFWGRTRVWPRDAIARVDRFTTYGRYGTRYVVFIGEDGRKLFSLSAPFWELDHVDRACRRVGMHLTGGFRDLESPYSLNRRVPGMVTWRSWALGFGLVAVIVVLAAVSVIASGPSNGG